MQVYAREQIARFHVYFTFVEAAAAVVTKQTSEFSLNVNSTKSTEEEEEESSWSERRVLQLMMILPTLLPCILTHLLIHSAERQD